MFDFLIKKVEIDDKTSTDVIVSTCSFYHLYGRFANYFEKRIQIVQYGLHVESNEQVCEII